MTNLDKELIKNGIDIAWFENNLDLIRSDMSACGVIEAFATINDYVESAKFVLSCEGNFTMLITSEMKEEFKKQIAFDMNLGHLATINDLEMHEDGLYFTIRYNKYTTIKYKADVKKVSYDYFWLIDFQLLDDVSEGR